MPCLAGDRRSWRREARWLSTVFNGQAAKTQRARAVSRSCVARFRLCALSFSSSAFDANRAARARSRGDLSAMGWLTPYSPCPDGGPRASLPGERKTVGSSGASTLSATLLRRLVNYAPYSIVRVCYVRVNYKPSSNLPFVGVVTAHFDWGEPPVLDQDSSRSDCTFSISGGVRAGDVNFSHADGVFGPALQPVE